MVDVGLLMNALEVVDTLEKLDLEFHEYMGVQQIGHHWRWRCRNCGLPLKHFLHQNYGRPRWFRTFQRAAYSEIDDALLAWKNDRHTQALLDAAVNDFGDGRL